MKWSTETYPHPETGVEMSNLVAKDTLKLINVNKGEALVRKNKNQTKFRIGVAEFTDAKGILRTPRVIINEGNYRDVKGGTNEVRMQEGFPYLTKLVWVPETKQCVFIMSHLVQGSDATEDWFDFSDMVEEAVDLEVSATKGSK